jgi:hypothetical protein
MLLIALLAHTPRTSLPSLLLVLLVSALPYHRLLVVARVPRSTLNGFVFRRTESLINTNNSKKPRSILVPPNKNRILLQATPDDQKVKKNPLLFQSSIPKEVRRQIYEAEGNTQAAKDRTVRLIVYIIFALIGSVLGIGNGILTELLTSESSTDNTATTIETSLAWLQDNPFLTTKWGGIVALVSAGVFGTLAELEVMSLIPLLRLSLFLTYRTDLIWKQ